MNLSFPVRRRILLFIVASALLGDVIAVFEESDKVSPQEILDSINPENGSSHNFCDDGFGFVGILHRKDGITLSIRVRLDEATEDVKIAKQELSVTTEFRFEELDGEGVRRRNIAESFTNIGFLKLIQFSNSFLLAKRGGRPVRSEHFIHIEFTTNDTDLCRTLVSDYLEAVGETGAWSRSKK